MFHPFWLKKVCGIHHLKNRGTTAHLLLINYLNKAITIDLDRKENESASHLLGDMEVKGLRVNNN